MGELLDFPAENELTFRKQVLCSTAYLGPTKAPFSGCFLEPWSPSHSWYHEAYLTLSNFSTLSSKRASLLGASRFSSPIIFSFSPPSCLLHHPVSSLLASLLPTIRPACHTPTQDHHRASSPRTVLRLPVPTNPQPSDYQVNVPRCRSSAATAAHNTSSATSGW